MIYCLKREWNSNPLDNGAALSPLHQTRKVQVHYVKVNVESFLVEPFHFPRSLEFFRSHDGALLLRRLLQLGGSQNTRLSRCVAQNDSSLLGGLDVALVVAADAVSDGDEAKFVFVEAVSMICCKIQKPLCQSVVVLLLLQRVVQSRMAEVLFPIGNQEGFQL